MRNFLALLRLALSASLLLLVSVACTPDETTAVPRARDVQPDAPPDPYEDSPSRFGVVPLHAGFSPDPRVVSGTAVGEVRARSIHRKCRGWISSAPDYLLAADTAFFQLYVMGRSQSDVALVVRKPDGSVVCNDDRAGAPDPMVRSNFPIGTTQIWVGVKEQGASVDYRLGFSEVKWRPSSIALPAED